MKILVTGACGFIGSHLAETLVRQGHDVRALVHYNSCDSFGWLDQSPHRGEMDIVLGDVRDPHCVRHVVKNCELVFHLAALIGIPYSYYAPESYVQTNVLGTLNIVQAARDVGGIKVINTSTSEVYGSAQFVPITEEHPLQAQSPYAASKIGADQIAMSYHLSYGLPVSVVRPFNTFGPRQSSRAVIPTIISQIASGSSRIKLGTLSPTRNFNFVEDTVSGLIAVGSSDAAVGEVINIGSDQEISIGDTANLIASLMNVELEIVSDDERLRPEKSEVQRLCASNEKAKRLVKWQPGFGDLAGFRRALETTIAWFREPVNLSRYKVGRYAV